jgi:hypothetical protein
MSPLTTTRLDHGVSPLSHCRRYEQVSVWSAIATLPVFAWEGSLGIYLMVKGFKPSHHRGNDRRHHPARPPRIRHLTTQWGRARVGPAPTIGPDRSARPA